MSRALCIRPSVSGAPDPLSFGATAGITKRGELIMHIGIAGLGKMGAAIAQRLMEVGHTGHGLEPLRRQDQAAGRCRRRRSPRRRPKLASQGRGGHHHPDRRRRDRRGLQRPSGLLSGDVNGKLFIEMSTVPPDRGWRSPERCARKGAALCRMPGRRHHRPGAAGQAARPDGRRAGRCGARQAHPRSALPAARACRAGRRRRGPEVHHQHAADDLLAGARRGAGALPLARARSRRG